ncbi:MAG: TlpA family protein disulfide reductase [Myxococcales bacterium]|nr:TlpA family protein disulfide reductase [Myxococcales bacterium]
MASDQPVAASLVLLNRRTQQLGKSQWSERIVLLALLVMTLLMLQQALRGIWVGEKIRPGVVAPAFRGPNLSDKLLALEDFKGSVVLLDFWATWCPPCIVSLPKLERIHQRYAKEGFTVLAINQEPGQIPMLRSFVASRELTFPVVVDSGTIADTYRVSVLPTMVLIDRNGVVRAYFRGTVGEKRLAALVESLLRVEEVTGP